MKDFNNGWAVIETLFKNDAHALTLGSSRETLADWANQYSITTKSASFYRNVLNEAVDRGLLVRGTSSAGYTTFNKPALNSVSREAAMVAMLGGAVLRNPKNKRNYYYEGGHFFRVAEGKDIDVRPINIPHNTLIPSVKEEVHTWVVTSGASVQLTDEKLTQDSANETYGLSLVGKLVGTSEWRYL